MATKIEYTPMRIIQTSKENAEKLLAGESITTAEGEVITFGMNDILVTPDDTVAKVSGLDNRVTALENATPPEIDTSKFVTTDTEQTITGIKTFTDDVYFEFCAIFSGTLYSDMPDGFIATENNGLYISLADGSMYAYSPDKDTFYKGHGIDIDWLDKSENTHSYSLNFPEKESGTYTLATTDDCKKLYRHNIIIGYNDPDNIENAFNLHGEIISSKPTPLTINEVKEIKGETLSVFGYESPNNNGCAIAQFYDSTIGVTYNNEYRSVEYASSYFGFWDTVTAL